MRRIESHINFNQNESGAELLLKQITENGGKVITVQADVTSAAEVEALIKKTKDEFGTVDVLVNNAGSLIERLRILDMSEERWDQVIDLNLKTAYLCSKAVAPTMIERKSGVIINISSIAGRNGGALGSMHYAAAKGGLISFTKGLAKELAPHGVRVQRGWTPRVDRGREDRFPVSAG